MEPRKLHIRPWITLLILSPILSASLGVVEAGMMGPGMMGAFPPGIAPELLPEPGSEPARLVQEYCTQCHALPGPGLHTAEEWPSVVGRMNMRMQMMGNMRAMMGGMGMMGGIKAPSERELDLILAYLQQHAQKPLGQELQGALETKAGQVFQSICSQCHALPDPKQHTVEEWPAVVNRMKLHETTVGKFVPDAAETRQILDFLRRYAQAGK